VLSARFGDNYEATPNSHGDSARFANSAEFWQMIHDRRQEKGIPWEEAEKVLDLE
jgi:hypothetical protein